MSSRYDTQLLHATNYLSIIKVADDLYKLRRKKIGLGLALLDLERLNIQILVKPNKLFNAMNNPWKLIAGLEAGVVKPQLVGTWVKCIVSLVI